MPITKEALKNATEDSQLLCSEETEFYRSFVGKINWLSTTTHAVLALPHSLLARFSNSPNKTALGMLKTTLRYCKHVMDKGIRSNPSSSEGLRVYTDANWAGFYSIDGSVYSRTGVFITYNETPIQWVSSKQSAISGSSANAEIYAISTGCGYGKNVAMQGEHINT